MGCSSCINMYCIHIYIYIYHIDIIKEHNNDKQNIPLYHLISSRGDHSLSRLGIGSMLSSWARISRQYRTLSCYSSPATEESEIPCWKIQQQCFYSSNTCVFFSNLSCIQCEFKVICERQQMNSEGCEVKQKTRTFMNILPGPSKGC